MPGELLIDTNIVIASFKGQQSILNRLAAATEIYVSTISVGELIYGALKSANQTGNLDRIQQWFATAVVLPCDTDTARCYSGIKHELQQKGRPIPDNDLWIAASAIQHNLLLLTCDRHFAEISQLRVEICR
jgi:tRNA(fMet)-specific endonuclease VapC